MWIATIANIATPLTVLTGVGLGLVEAGRARKDRDERAAFAALDAILTPEWMKSIVIAHAIPEETIATEIEADARVPEATHVIGITLEGIGYAVFARIVPLKTVLVEAYEWRGVTCVTRSTLSVTAPVRRRAGNGFEWLAEQVGRHGTSRTSLRTGAYVAYDWKPLSVRLRARGRFGEPAPTGEQQRTLASSVERVLISAIR